MTVSLFQNISHFKAIIGGAVNATLHMGSIAPFFDLAHDQHLADWLGTDLYGQLADAVGADSYSPAQTALLPLYQQALAWLTLFEYMPHAAVQIGETGVYRIENEQYKSAYKYQEKAVKEKLLNNGYEALEKLIVFLEANKSTYTQWPAAPGYEKHHDVVLRTAADFRMAHSKRLSRHVFELLRGVIEDVEQFVFVKMLGEAQYESLLSHRKTGTWTDEALEKRLMYLMNRATAHFALSEALRLHWVQLEGDRVVQKEYLEEQGVPKEGTAGTFAVGTRINAHDDTANRYVNKVRELLANNFDAPAFADYKAHQAALAEALAEAVQAMPPIGTDRGACTDGWNPPPPRRKGVMRL